MTQDEYAQRRDRAVDAYRALGLKTVQIDPQTKAPRALKWQQLDAPPEDFSPDDGVGVCYQNTPFVDLDLDWDEAPQIADSLLLQTLCFGRPSRRAAHRVYRCPDLTTGKKFTLPRELSDVRHPLVAERDHERMVIEINCNSQAVWPPTVHQSGEVISFEGGLEPTQIEVLDIEEVEPGELLRLAGLIAFSTVCAAAYPSTGERHDYVNAICGALVRAGTFSDEEIVAAVGAIAREAGDDEAESRENEITPAETREKVRRGDPVTGLKKLVELMGVHERMARVTAPTGNAPDNEESSRTHWEVPGAPVEVAAVMIRTLRRWIADEKVSQEEDLLDQMNAQYAKVVEGAAKGETLSIDPDGSVYFVKPEKAKSIHKNELIYKPDKDGKLKAYNPFDLWEGSKARRDISHIIFEPPGSLNYTPHNAFNLWSGFNVLPEAGDAHEPFLDHISNIVCQGDEEHYRWVLVWMADLIQQPGNKPGLVLVLRGAHGVGKSIILEYLAQILGRHAHKSSTKEVYTSRFNMHLRDKVLVGLEEAFHAGDRKAASELKDLITSPTMESEQKFHDKIILSNHLHFLITANHDWTVSVEGGDRRYAVLDVSAERKEDRAYFKPIWDALNYGKGASNLLHYLQNLEYSREELWPLPRTDARSDQIERTLDAPDQWLLAVIRGEQPIAVSQSGAEPPSTKEAREAQGLDPLDDFQSKQAVFTSFRTWADTRKVRNADGMTDSMFWKRLRTILGALKIKRRGRGGQDGQFVRIGREAAVKGMAHILECEPEEVGSEVDYGEPANDDFEIERQLREIL